MDYLFLLCTILSLIIASIFTVLTASLKNKKSASFDEENENIRKSQLYLLVAIIFWVLVVVLMGVFFLLYFDNVHSDESLEYGDSDLAELSDADLLRTLREAAANKYVT